MPQKKGGIMVILSSPSGAGKTTLVKLLTKRNNFIFQFLIPLENQGLLKLMVKIIFLSLIEEFKRLIKNQEF